MGGYIPSHLAFENRQFDGWPVGISEESKIWATRKVKTFLRKAGSQPFSLGYIYDHCFGQYRDEPLPADLFASLTDFLMAYTHRALLAAGAEQVWVLRS